MAKGRYPEINLLNLIINGNYKHWNNWLADCERDHNLPDLLKTLSGIQQGMDTLVKGKLNTDNITVIFLRMQRSIENTIKNIYRKQNPTHKVSLAEKREQDNQLERFMHGNRY